MSFIVFLLVASMVEVYAPFLRTCTHQVVNLQRVTRYGNSLDNKSLV